LSSRGRESLARRTFFLGTLFQCRGNDSEHDQAAYFDRAAESFEESVRLNPIVGVRYNYIKSLLELGAKSISPEQKRKWFERCEAEQNAFLTDLPKFDQDDPFFAASDDWTPRYVAYNHACLKSLDGRHNEALEILAELVEEDCIPWDRINSDADFDPIRDLPEFQAMADRKSG